MAVSSADRPVLRYYKHLSPRAPEAPELSPDASVELGRLCAACQRVQTTLQQEIDVAFGKSKMKVTNLHKFSASRLYSMASHELYQSKMVGMYYRHKDRKIAHEWIELYPSITDFHDAFRNGCHLCTLLWSAHSKAVGQNRLLELLTDEPDTAIMVRLSAEYGLTRDASFELFLEINSLSEDEDDNEYYEAAQHRIPLLPPERCHGLTGHQVSYPVSTASPSSLDLASNWIRACVSGHAQCKQHKSSFVPTRLIDVSTVHRDRTIRIVLSEWIRKPAEYAALSYCWGEDVVLKLRSTNTNQFMSGITVDMFAQTIQDAIYLTKSLGIDWLWIDSLCILQDSRPDFLQEAATMCDVYQNSLVTLAGIGAASSSQGLHSLRDPLMYIPCPLLRTPESEPLSASIPESILLGIKTKLWPLYSRGWVLQERILSPRTLKMGPCMLWECREESKQEFLQFTAAAQENSLSADFWAAAMRNPIDVREFRDMWKKLLSNYSSTNFSRYSDKLIALSGVITALERMTGWKNAHGLWMPFMAQELLWLPKKASWSTGVMPTWSWAGWSGIDGPGLYKGRDTIADFELLDSWESVKRGESHLRPALRVNCLAIRLGRYRGANSHHPQGHQAITSSKGKLHYSSNHANGVLDHVPTADESPDRVPRNQLFFDQVQAEYFLILLHQESSLWSHSKRMKEGLKEVRGEFLRRGSSQLLNRESPRADERRDDDDDDDDRSREEYGGFYGLAVVPSEDCPGAYERVGLMSLTPDQDRRKDVLIPPSVVQDRTRRMDFVLV